MTNESSRALWAKVWQDRLLISLSFICNLSRCQESTLSFLLSFLFFFFCFSFLLSISLSFIQLFINSYDFIFPYLLFFSLSSICHSSIQVFIYLLFILSFSEMFFMICFSTFLFIFFTSICCPIFFFIQWLAKMLSVLAYNIGWKCKKVEIFQLFIFLFSYLSLLSSRTYFAKFISWLEAVAFLLENLSSSLTIFSLGKQQPRKLREKIRSETKESCFVFIYWQVRWKKKVFHCKPVKRILCPLSTVTDVASSPVLSFLDCLLSIKMRNR